VGSALVSRCGVSALSFLNGILKPCVANEFDVAEFAVDDIKDIEWQPEALSHLQMPQKKKRAIQALLEAHMKRASTNSFSFDDLIAGKGLGFNVLMQYDD
jgi:hypothetical protein